MAQTINVIFGATTVGGTADAITAVYSPVLTALTNRRTLSFKAAATNTGAVTFSPDGLTVRAITNKGGVALVAGQIQQNMICLIQYDLTNTRWELLNPASVLNYDQASSDINMTGNAVVNVAGVENGNSVIDMGGGLYFAITTDANGYVTPYLYLQPSVAASLSFSANDLLSILAAQMNVKHSSRINLDSPEINLPNETASRIMATDSSKNIDTPYTFSTDGTLASNSDSIISSQKALKTYIDQAVTGLLDFKGDLDASANPNYPSASKGDAYYITVAGKVGGASGKSVDVGDLVIAKADNAGGTEAAVGTSWFVIEHNLVGALLSSNNLSDVSNASTARTNLGLAIGTNVQAWDADLDAIAALGFTATSFLKKTAANTWALDTNTYLTTSDAASNYQPLDSDLTAIAALSPSNDDIIQRKAGAWTNRTMAQLRADMGDYFTIGFLTRNFSPADSTTYYMSWDITPTTTASNSTFKLGYAATLVGAIITASNNTVSGTNESGTIYLRNETAATSSLISNTVKTNASTTQQISQTVTGLNISVAATDDITLQFDSPAYATNPTAFVWRITLFFSRT